MYEISQEEKWKMYEASDRRIQELNQQQITADNLSNKWIMTLSSGVFGLSFAFINTIVPLEAAHSKGLLITSWGCFAGCLVVELIGLMVSSFSHILEAEKEAHLLELRYNGNPAEYKKRTHFFSGVAILGYISFLTFIGGIVCLFTFIAKNLI